MLTLQKDAKKRAEAGCHIGHEEIQHAQCQERRSHLQDRGERHQSIPVKAKRRSKYDLQRRKTLPGELAFNHRARLLAAAPPATVQPAQCSMRPRQWVLAYQPRSIYEGATGRRMPVAIRL